MRLGGQLAPGRRALYVRTYAAHAYQPRACLTHRALAVPPRRRQGRRREAASALALLLGLRARGGGAGSGPRAGGVGLDTALLHIELARLQLALGETTAAAVSVAAADAAAADAAADADTDADTVPASEPASVPASAPAPVPAWLREAAARPEAMQVLELRRRGMAALPACISTMSALRVLDVSENRLESLPESIGMRNHGVRVC